MKISEAGQISGGQDGAIFENFLFRLNAVGLCKVHTLDNLSEVFSEFMLDKTDEIIPHSNAVQFGTEYFDESDEFPLLYTNIYNNYSSKPNPMKGVCLVYRIRRDENKFTTTLVQKITIGFVEDDVWKSGDDVRPYGNFVVDCDRERLYAFVMRDNDKVCRYFALPLPKLSDGFDVVIQKSDIIEYFDCPYHYYVQGATCYKGKIYSTEGFNNDLVNIPAIRVIDILKKEQISYTNIMELGYTKEPEFIDFTKDGTCLYSDAHGNLYALEL